MCVCVCVCIIQPPWVSTRSLNYLYLPFSKLHHCAVLVSRDWAKASYATSISLSCAILCQMVRSQQSSSSSLHRLAGLPLCLPFVGLPGDDTQYPSVISFPADMPCPGRDFVFPDTNFVKALLAMLSALRLVAGSKHAPRAFGSATGQAGASSDQGIHKIHMGGAGQDRERFQPKWQPHLWLRF